MSVFAALLSNLVSNVPAVLVFKGFVPHLADPARAWLTLAMASTLAGNLTVLGSVANLIVVAARAREVRDRVLGVRCAPACRSPFFRWRPESGC